MNPKMKSAIEKITLNDATFSNEVIEPTYVNFFYGKNGAGKSTIARTFKASLAMIDYALRRRFSFFDMEPGFDSEGFIKYQEGFANDTFNTLIDRIKELNQEIAKDKSLGKGFCIGHSYFCNTDECTEEWMQDVVDFDVLPMLAEYWFDDTDKLQRWENILHGVFQ